MTNWKQFKADFSAIWLQDSLMRRFLVVLAVIGVALVGIVGLMMVGILK